MQRSLTALGLLVCLAAPALAADLTWRIPPTKTQYATLVAYVTAAGDDRLIVAGKTLHLGQLAVRYQGEPAMEQGTEAGRPWIKVTGETAEGFHVEKTLWQLEDGLRVKYVLTARRDNVLPPPLRGMTGEPFDWPRFVGPQGDRLVWGYLNDMTENHTVAVEKWMEVGPIGFSLLHYDLGPNDVLHVKGFRVDSSVHVGFCANPYELTKADPRPRNTGEVVEYHMTLHVRDNELPWQVSPDEGERVIPDRKFDFLVTPPNRTGIEIEPVDLPAPVFGYDEPIRLRITSEPGVLTCRVTDAFTGEEVAAPTLGPGGATPPGRQTAILNWKAPSAGVYNLAFTLQGETARQRTYQVPVVGPIEQPDYRYGEQLPLELVDTINCADPQDPHPFWFNEETRVVNSPLGAYRETAAQSGAWYAYQFPVEPRQTYVVEVDYPDDADRCGVVEICEPPDPGKLGMARLRSPSGYSTGIQLPITNEKQTLRMVYFSGATPWASLFLFTDYGVWKPTAALGARIYRLKGTLPKLVKPAGSGRPLVHWTESGDISFFNFYDGDFLKTTAPTHAADPNFYREWYTSAQNLVRYLRYCGQTGFVCGVCRYDTAQYPSQSYFHSPMNEVSSDYAALLAKLFSYNQLDLYPGVLLTRVWPGLSRGARYTQYEVRHQAAPTPVCVDREGKQDMITFLAGVPAMNPASPELKEALGQVAQDMAKRYCVYPSVKGIFWLSGGAWQPFYTVFGGNVQDERMLLSYSYDDATMTRFFRELGQPLPGDPTDPQRFRIRADWIWDHAKPQWVDFRARVIAEANESISQAIREVAPKLTFFPCQGQQMPEIAYKMPQLTPLEGLKRQAFDPAAFTQPEGLTYVVHQWCLAGRMAGNHQELGAEKLKSVFIPAHLRALLDPDLNDAYNAPPHAGLFLHRQFSETATGFRAGRPIPPGGFFEPGPEHGGTRWVIDANCYYSEEDGWRFFHDFGVAFARKTPEFVSWMWEDGRIAMGHEEQVQYLSLFLGSLPLGKYESVAPTEHDVYCRFQRPTGAFYLANLQGEPRQVSVSFRGVTGLPGLSLTDGVSGEKIPLSPQGVARIALDRAGLRSFRITGWDKLTADQRAAVRLVLRDIL